MQRSCDCGYAKRNQFFVADGENKRRRRVLSRLDVENSLMGLNLVGVMNIIATKH
jgi:hypothetical protein